ncbi:hypothetical protein [Spirillospora sp. NPDC047279]|uniref:hypothetical protein n=1 Tax=Spirillospora sp. NPDC047279 TaxID=3155478 RepID=UPI0034101DD3
MSIEQTAWRDAEALSEMATEFAGWRLGRGGSGHYWAVRGNDLVRTRNVEELRARLHELTTMKRSA